MICEHSEELVRSSFPIMDSSLTKCCRESGRMGDNYKTSKVVNWGA